VLFPVFKLVFTGIILFMHQQESGVQRSVGTTYNEAGLVEGVCWLRPPPRPVSELFVLFYYAFGGE
jgi:hypothetical protein